MKRISRTELERSTCYSPNMAIVSWDNKELLKFENDLRRFAAKALPFANRATINDQVFAGQRIAKKLLDEKFILRNKWTQRSIRVKKATQKHIRDQQGKIGAIDEYLARTERGGVKRSKGKHGVPIPTRVASGEGRGASPRQRAVRPRTQLRNLRLDRQRLSNRPRNRAQKNIILLLTAARRGGGFVLLHTRRGKGIYQVRGRAVRRKRKGMSGADIESVDLIYDLSRKSVFVRSRPWLAPTLKIVKRIAPALYRKNLRKQVKRWGLFKR